jgi:predicted amino acid-binding ACT domain protein
MWAEKRPHEWLGGVLGVSGLAPSAHISQIKQKVLKGYFGVRDFVKIQHKNEILILRQQLFSFHKKYELEFYVQNCGRR